MVWVIAFGELFFGDLWCVVWGYGGMRTHFSLLNPLSPAFFWHLWQGFGHLSTVSCDLSMFFGTYPRDIGQAISPIDELFTYGHAAAHR